MKPRAVENEYLAKAIELEQRLDRLQKADNALKALKTAAAAASDFASLQTAIATALADI